jgi:hypothetical protein
MKKTLHELRTTGFNKLRPGHIHIRCSKCGRKQSNAVRTEYDPESAFLAEVLCDKCSMGCKDCSPDYFNEKGYPVFLCLDCEEQDARMGDDYCTQCRTQVDKELADLEAAG